MVMMVDFGVMKPKNLLTTIRREVSLGVWKFWLQELQPENEPTQVP
jgi:hypothetical protein